MSRAAAGVLLVASVVLAGCGPPESAPSERPAPDRPTPVTPSVERPVVDDERDPEMASALARAAWALLAWPALDVVRDHQRARLDEPVLPGSLMKVVVARAALDHGVPVHDLRILCPRRLEIGGRRLECVHPDLGRPLSLPDALAHSCNHFFVRLAERVTRAHLTRTLGRLSAGRVQLSEDAPLPLVALGLEGPRASLRTWAATVVAAAAPTTDGTVDVGPLALGLVHAAQRGTASALADPAAVTLAKTGTTVVHGMQEGVVVAWRPDVGAAVIVRAAGIAGRDAARLARALLDDQAEAAMPRVRVGRLTQGEGLVDDLPLETYVAGVVSGEAESDMPAATHDAVAIGARSVVRGDPGRHQRDGYDVCDTTHCQVLRAPTPWGRAAADRTRGVILVDRDRPVAVPYSAVCSGTLLAPRAIWGGEMPTITRVGPDPSPHAVPTWRSDVGAPALLQALRATGHRGDVLRDLRIGSRSSSGVPATVILDGLSPPVVDATRFRHVVGRALGWDTLKSHTWDVERTARGFRFTGQGKGHGVGLCVTGAAVQARAGGSARAIWERYAPGAQLRAEQDTLTLRVPGVSSGRAAGWRRAALARLADLRVRLGVGAPRAVEIVVHPTRQAYQRATGRAWWTSASTRRVDTGGYRIDITPEVGDLAVSPVLAHELVHVLTADGLTYAPAWVAEGLAAWLSHAGPGAAAPAPGAAACPDDLAMTRPGSPEAMRAAYAAAAGCVAGRLVEEAGAAGWRTLAVDGDAPSRPASSVYGR